MLLCLVTTDRKRIRGKLGLGGGIDDLAELFDAPLSNDNEPLVNALLARQDLFIPPEELSRFEGSDLLRPIKPACFGLYPLVVNELVVGAIYFDRTLPAAPPDPAILTAIPRLRDLAATAIARTRGRT